MHARTRSAPAALADEARPGGDRREDAADALGVEAQGAQWHVAQRRVEHHVLDRGGLDGAKLLRRRARAGRSIIEPARGCGAAPGVVARGGEAEDLEDHGEWQQANGSADGVKYGALAVALRKPLARELEARCAHDGEREPDDGCEERDAALQAIDAVKELLTVLVDSVEGDDWARNSASPGRACRARDPQLAKARDGLVAVDAFAKPMVVGATASHGRSMPGRTRSRAGGSGATCEKSSIPDVSHLRTPEFGMSWCAAGNGSPAS